MQIRELEMGDIPFVARMEAKYSGNPWNENALFTYFLRDDTILLVADENDAVPTDEDFNPDVVGFIGLVMMAPESDVLDITVLPEKRNRGIGRKMMAELFLRARQKGVTTTYLEVRQSNAPARHLYDNMDFQPIGIRKHYYTDPVEDAIAMKRVDESGEKGGI